MRISKNFLIGLAVTSIFSLSGCYTAQGFGKDVEIGGKEIQKAAKDANDPAADPSTKVVQAQKIAISNFAFNPAKMTIPVGTTITWTNNDYVKHDVTFKNFASKELSQGETYSHKFDTKGTYSYICEVHPSMTGEITVK